MKSVGGISYTATKPLSTSLYDTFGGGVTSQPLRAADLKENVYLSTLVRNLWHHHGANSQWKPS